MAKRLLSDIDVQGGRKTTGHGSGEERFFKADGQAPKEIQKEEIELRWIRNIERGTKGAWHTHLIITGCRDTIRWVEECWPYGGIYAEQLEKSKYYEEDCSQLASYITKSEKVGEKKEDGSREKPRLSESSYSTSKNMPLKPPKRSGWRDGRGKFMCRKGTMWRKAMRGSIQPRDSDTGGIR